MIDFPEILVYINGKYSRLKGLPDVAGEGAGGGSILKKVEAV